MTSNIGKLCTFGKQFLSRVWIQDHYLKIRLCLTLIHLKIYHFCTEIRVDDSSTFIRNGGHHFEEEVKMNLLTPSLAIKSYRRLLFQSRVWHHYCAHRSPTRLSSWGTVARGFCHLGVSLASAWGETMAGSRWSGPWLCGFQRERERAKRRERERRRQRGEGRGERRRPLELYCEVQWKRMESQGKWKRGERKRVHFHMALPHWAL